MGSASSEFGKDLGLMHELAVTGRKVGFIPEDWGILAHSEELLLQVLDVVCGQADIAKKPNCLLELVSTVVIPARSTPFVARNKFVLGTNATAPVKISHFSKNFTDWFLGKTEEPLPEQTLRYAKLGQISLDGSIIAELGGEEKAETTLSELLSLMEGQKNGEDGPLLSNGWWNIFYIKDCNCVLRTVYVYWFDGGWCVDASSTGSPFTWRAGFRVFSRNSC